MGYDGGRLVSTLRTPTAVAIRTFGYTLFYFHAPNRVHIIAGLSKSHNNTIPTSLSLYKIVDKDGGMIIDLASPLASLVFH